MIKDTRVVSSPCAACKLLRRRCAKDCVFAPYFPADEPLKFACVHKVFGASNVSKMLQDLPEHHRGDAVSSMVYEANARLRDRVYGCVGVISSLQHLVAQLQTQLAVAQAEIVSLQMYQGSNLNSLITNSNGLLLPARSAPMAPSSNDSKLHHKPSNSPAGAQQIINEENSLWT